MRIAVVVNPAAGGGGMGRAWPSFAEALTRRFGTFEMRETKGPGEASVAAHGLAAQGAETVVAAGGDGTVSEVADGLIKFAAEGGAAPALAAMPVGTGTDFARCFGVPREAEACARAIAEAAPRRIDAGRVSFVDDTGRAAVRHFVSVASLGISGAIDRTINAAAAKRRGRLSGKALFFFYTARELLRYRFPEVSIAVDGGEPFTARIVLVAVANNPSFGGGMMIAPDAKPDDGRFEIVVARATSRLAMLRDLRLVYSGAHRDLPSCSFLSGRTVTVAPLGGTLENTALLDIDGESPGRIPATFEMLEGALTLRGSTGGEGFRTG